jgi:hypothetical protein
VKLITWNKRFPATKVAAKITKSPSGDFFQPAQAGFVGVAAVSGD